MKSFNITSKVKSLVFLSITLLSVNYANSKELKTNSQFKSTERKISKSGYPEMALKNNIKGRVVVYFELLNSTVKNITIVQSVDKYLDEEAINVANSMTKEYIQELEGTGKTKFHLPVEFKIL